MKNSSLARQLAKLPGSADVFVMLPDGTVLPLQAAGVKAVKAAPREEGGKLRLVRSKRASKRVVITTAPVAEDGPDDAQVAPEPVEPTRPGMQL